MSEPNTTAPRATPGQALAAWRKSAEKTQTECAAAVDVRQNTWSEWEADSKQPQIKYAIRIERLTGGAVPVTCWEPAEPTLETREAPAKGATGTDGV